MIALFFLFLTLSVSPFKSKSRLEAENAALRHQLSVLQAQGAGSSPAHKWGSLVLGPAVAMVSIGAQGHHYHPTGDPGALASGRLSSLLALFADTRQSDDGVCGRDRGEVCDATLLCCRPVGAVG